MMESLVQETAMAKWANTSVMDALLDKVATANQIIVATAQPTDRADALSKSLAATSLAGGDFSKANSTSPSGRKLTVAQKANISVTDDGTATHIALVDGTNLLYVTTVDSQAMTSGNTVTIPSWTIISGSPE